MGRHVGIAVLLLMMAIGPVSAEAPSRTSKRTVAKQTARPKPPANPCAVYGAGFVAIAGTSTCIRTGGSIGVGSAF